jgi:NADH-quinone oxidoreductase subunit M
MSKAGVFGFIVWVLPIFPLSLSTSSCLMWLGLFTAVYGALMALRATDGKKLLAFSSMGHLGLAVAGVFSGSEVMFPAVLVLLVAHGISAGAQFFLMGIAERMTGTRELDELGGLSSKNPVFSTLFGFAGVMALAVPGTAGFVGEFSVLLSLWDMGPLPALVAGFTLILSAAYMLRFIQKVIFGKQAREYVEGERTMPLEGFSIGVMLSLLLVFGFHPAFVTDSLNQVEEIEDPAATQVLQDASINQGNAPMTEEEIHQLDSTLAAAGFKDDERASIIAQMRTENGSEATANSENTVKEASDDK